MDNLELLIKYYQNQATADEVKTVEDWLGSSEDNRAAYKQYIAIWEASERTKILEKIDTKKDWEQIVKMTNKRHIPIYQKANFWIRIAAMVVFLIGSYWLFENKLLKPDYLAVRNESADMIKTVTLEDGTKVSLNYNAVLYYPKHFSKKSRHVMLDGNAFFNVAKNPNKPFEVETDMASVEVLGTSFDINENVNEMTVTVVTGRVKVSDNSTNKFEILVPDEQLFINENEFIKEKVSAGNFIGWKTGVFNFKNQTLYEAIQLLEKRHHFTYQFESDELKNRLISADFDGESLDDILEIIQLSCQVIINKESNHLTISKYE